MVYSTGIAQQLKDNKRTLNFIFNVKFFFASARSDQII